jgi:hypothetical protein
MMLIAVLAEKLDDAVSQAGAEFLVGDKHHKFFKILTIPFIQNLN